MLAFEAWPLELATGRRAEALAGAAQALAGALAAGLGYDGADQRQRRFDPAEVKNYLDWSADAGLDGFWADRKVAANRAIVAHDEPFAGRGEAGAGAARFRISLRRTLDLTRLPSGTPVRLRLPLPPMCEYHPEVSIRPIMPEGLAAHGAISESRLETRITLGEERRFTIGADLEIQARTPVPDDTVGRLSETEARIHLRAAEGPIQVTSRIRALALRLAGVRPPLQAVTALWEFMIGNFRFSALRYEEMGDGPAVDRVLETGVYDCLHCSVVLVSLCRALGIPARLVTGHYLYRLAPTNHTWVEIWIDGMGWLALDIHNRERNRPQFAAGAHWPWHFAERRDFRLVFQRLPLVFTGPMSVRFPPAWQMLHTGREHGVAITYLDVSDGSLIYRDDVSVERL